MSVTPPAQNDSALSRIAAPLAWLAEKMAVMAMFADLIVTFVNTIGRYVFHSGIEWSEDLSGIVLVGHSYGGMVVSGVAGVGKSRLLAEVAAASPVPVIAARAFCPERDDAWALARSLLREALALDCEAPRSLPERPAP